MVKIIYDDWTEKEINESDYISRAELEENYLSKSDVEENYVTKEKYDLKKKQAKEAFRQSDLAKKQVANDTEAELTAKIEEKVTFKAKHGFDEIPQEILELREKHPTLNWEDAYKISSLNNGETTPVITNPNPWREDLSSMNEKLTYTEAELANLASTDIDKYNAVASGIEKGEIKIAI